MKRPRPQEDAARHLSPAPAKEAELRVCKLPPGLVVDWPQAFLRAFGQVLRRYRSFRLSLEACVNCGQCAGHCPFYQGTGDPYNMPMMRAELARDIYRKHFSPQARAARLLGRASPPPDEKTLLFWYTYFNQCSLCRACALHCPLGIDTSQITMACREIMARIGLAPEPVALAVASHYRYGNGPGLTPDSWLSRNRSLEELCQRRYGLEIKFPVDEYGADVLLIPGSNDLTSHQTTYMGYAKVFHAAGVSWTTSTFVSDGDNPGLYLDYRNLRLINRRVLQAVRELRPKMVVWGECGAGWWAARNFSATLSGSWQGMDSLTVQEPVSMLSWSRRLLSRGGLHAMLRKEANDHRVVTYHDPCHLARSTDLTGAARDLIRASCHFFHELPAQVSGVNTQCCGGGGGLWGPELAELRMAGFMPRARSLSRINQEQGVNWVATACGQCKSTLLEGLSHYSLPLERGGVHQLLGDALYSPQEAGDSPV